MSIFSWQLSIIHAFAAYWAINIGEMPAFTKNIIFVKMLGKVKQTGGKIAFGPWFSPKFTNFFDFCKCCLFFDIHRSVSCENLDNREFQRFTYDLESRGFSTVSVKKAPFFRFGWIMVLDLLGFIWMTHRISELGPYGQLKSGSSTVWSQTNLGTFY